MRKVKDAVCLTMASAFGLGLLPVAPGSFGALLGVGIHLAVVRFVAGTHQQVALITGFLAVCGIHFILTPWAQKYWNDSDPANFVLDEVAGYLVVPLLVKIGPLWFIVVVGFLLFRILDIIKIPPARQIDQHIHDAWGVLLDDLVSGLYASGIVYLVARWIF